MADQPQNKTMTPDEVFRRRYEKAAKYLGSDLFKAELLANAPPWTTEKDGGRSYHQAVAGSVLTACENSQDYQLLLRCDFKSLIDSVIKIVRRGLIVGDNICWLVPYGGKVQDQLGYMGLYQLALRFGLVTQVRTQSVFENDPCNINLGVPVKIDHAPAKGPRGPFIGTWAWVEMPGGGQDAEWMDKATVDYIRTQAPSKGSPAWNKWYDEQARAKVMKRLLKRVPKPMNYDPGLMRDMDDAIEAKAEDVRVGRPALSAPAEQPINKLDSFVREQKGEKVPADTGYLDDDAFGGGGWAALGEEADHDQDTGEVKQAATQRQGPRGEREPSLGSESARTDDRPAAGAGAPSAGKAPDDVALILPGKKAIEYHQRNVASTIIQREAEGRDTKWLAAIVANNGWIIGTPLEKVLDGLRKALVEGEHD